MTISSWFQRRPLALFFTLYAVIFSLAWFAHSILPSPFDAAERALMGGAGLGIAEPGAFGRAASRVPMPEAPLWTIATIAMLSGGLLSLPIAWLYTITRHKRGYSQSVVQTLILLPVVVAGVVVLVKFSLALAFSLAGIVAAVRFRNTLDDSKDAVFIFVATGVGIAAGVELTAAATLSFVFNAVTLILFLTDFGGTPAHLEGDMAEQRMQRALSVANRTSQFVARIDSEILEDMAPAQLEALAERAWKRRQESGDVSGRRLERVLRVNVADGIAARAAVEAVLTRDTKRYALQGSESIEGGGQRLTYGIRLRKSVDPVAMLNAIRVQQAAGVLSADLDA